jgi:outer membrane lipoprotein SlyB
MSSQEPIMKRSLFLAGIVLGVVILAGCASPAHRSEPVTSYPAYPASQTMQRYPQPSQTYEQYGTVESLQFRQASSGGIGMGAVVGGVVGGVLGNQVGGGKGRQAATVAGVVGGALVGNEIEQRNTPLREEVVVGVRLDNGGYRTLLQESAAGLHIGARVRLDNDRVYRAY